MNSRGEDSTGPVGLIAGAGRMPGIVAEGIVASGRRLVTVGLRGFAETSLGRYSDRFARAGLLQVGRWIRILRREGVREAVLIGSVRKADMHARRRLLQYLPDFRAVRIWYGTIRHDRRDNAVLLAVADALQKGGIQLVSSVKYCSDHLAEEGVMTRRKPGREALCDAEFGWKIARAAADLDIGQSLAVRDMDIIAVEAVEGTDAMIRRAGELCPRGGWTLVKVARPNQDMRFDVPTIGPQTMRLLAEAGCACVVVEAGKTLLADKPMTLELADQSKIAVLGRCGH